MHVFSFKVLLVGFPLVPVCGSFTCAIEFCYNKEKKSEKQPKLHVDRKNMLKRHICTVQWD
jgi:hypothetical protein